MKGGLLTQKRTRIIRIINFDNFFIPPEDGEFWQKCLRLQLRELWRVRAGDVIVVYGHVDQHYLDYVMSMTGTCFKQINWDQGDGELLDSVGGIRGDEVFIFHPRQLLPGRLSLIDSILDDDKLLTLLRMVRAAGKFDLSPLVQHPALFKLSELTNIDPEPGCAPDLVETGMVQNLFNSKVWGLRLASDVSVAIPAGCVVQGKGNIMAAASARLVKGVSCMLRLDLAAGGLGNKLICPSDLDILDQLIEELEPAEQWDRQSVLVEELIELESCGPDNRINGFSVKFRIEEHLSIEKMPFTVVGRIVKNGESCGAIAPYAPPQSADLDLLVRRLAIALHLEGYRGEADIDLGLTTDGSWIFFELNARRVATEVQEHIGRTLLGEQPHVTLSDEQLEVGEIYFNQLVIWTLAWPKFVPGSRVVITIPPESGKAAIVVVADDSDTLRRAHKHLLSLIAGAKREAARDLWAGKYVPSTL